MSQQPYSEELTMNSILNQEALEVTLPTKEAYGVAMQKHAALHSGQKKYTRLDLNEKSNEDGDLACLNCYPIDTKNLTPEFITFRDEWFSPLYKPLWYTQNTVVCFEAARKEKDFERLVERIKLLLCTIRFKTWPREGLEAITSSLMDTWKQTFGFEQIDKLSPSGRSTPGELSYAGPLRQNNLKGKRKDDQLEENYGYEPYDDLERNDPNYDEFETDLTYNITKGNDDDDDDDDDDDVNDANNNNIEQHDPSETLHINTSD